MPFVHLQFVFSEEANEFSRRHPRAFDDSPDVGVRQHNDRPSAAFTASRTSEFWEFAPIFDRGLDMLTSPLMAGQPEGFLSFERIRSSFSSMFSSVPRRAIL